MSSEPVGRSEAAQAGRRVLAQVAGAEPGPTLFVLAGIHGNEPAGAQAVERLARGLASRGLARGDLVCLAGNLAAARRGIRFVDLDLNRAWTEERVGGRREPGPVSIEDREQVELLGAIARAAEAARGPLYFIDMHTSSAPGPAFLTVGDTLGNRAFARAFPLPLILGLEEQIDGSLLEYLSERGFVTLGIEGGQHDEARAVDRLEAALWIALVATGMLDAAAVPNLARHRRVLEEAGSGVPRVVEVWYRHLIAQGDQFSMLPGFKSYDRVRTGQNLARDKHGLVLAPGDGRILLPLYQPQGDDGFFLVREVSPAWLRVSSAVRRLRLSWLVRLLPGVHSSPERAGALRVNTRIARWYALELMHLAGYRKQRRIGSDLIVTRRREAKKGTATFFRIEAS